MPPPSGRLDLAIITADEWRRAARTRVSRAIESLRASWPRVLVGAGIGVGISILVAFVAPGQQEGAVRSGLAWFALTAIVTGLTTRLAMVGPRRFWVDVRGFPRRIVALVREDGSAALVHILLGFAAGTFITWLLGPTLGGLLGIGLFVSLGTMLRSLIVGGAMVAWRWLVSRLALRNPAATPIDATAVSLLGTSAAMALALAVPSVSARLAIGLAAVVLALLLRGRGARSSLLTAAIVVAIAALGGALAIDASGGFESPDVLWLLAGGFTLGVLLTSTGLSLSVLRGAFAAGSSGWAGAALGAVIGALVGLLCGVFVDMPAVPVTLGAALGALLLVPPIATRLGAPVGRWTRPLTGSSSSESGIQVLALSALVTVVAGLTGGAVGSAMLIVSAFALVLVRWGSLRMASSALLMLGLVATTMGASVSAQESAPPIPTPGGIREAKVEVRADRPMTDTGFDVLAGETLHLKATGAVRLVAGDDASVVDADGEPGRYGGCDLGLYCGTLVGSFRSDGLSRFKIGSETLLPPMAAGRLYLAVNDADPADDSGSFSVTIRAGPANALGVVLPTPPGVSRDTVLADDADGFGAAAPADGEAASAGGAPSIDLLIAAVLGALGAIGGALAVRRVATGDGQPAATG